MTPGPPPRLLLLASAHTYRLDPFLRAARKLGVEVVQAVDVPPAHAVAGEKRLGLDFRDSERCVRQVRDYARLRPLHAVLGTDDATVTLAARLSHALGLRHNSVESAEAARDKHRMRQLFAQAGVPSPWFQLFSVDDAPDEIAAEVRYPCVVKPTCLSGSRGVIRANDPQEFVPAFNRVRALLAKTGQSEVLVEGYLPGAEFALEGLLDDGRLHVLALFDKPDPLEGPFFEETIYVTPSRYPVDVQTKIVRCVQGAARALGLREGPVHAELRVNQGEPWMLEIAGRSIGGLCSQTLHFAQTGDVSLEELILRQALGPVLSEAEGPALSQAEGPGLAPLLQREPRAGGVMMIPIPAAGTLTGVSGLDQAQAVAGVESVEITARVNYPVAPLPEGDSYLGFIFARGEMPDEVEAALRAAHRRLQFEIVPELPVMND